MRNCKLKDKCRRVNMCKGCPRAVTQNNFKNVENKDTKKNNEAR